jgi:glycerol-3-phosphate dehydrogenase (NAD(P)+)
MKKTVGILGAGAFGTAIAKIIAEKGHDVTLWSFEKAITDEINQKHTNKYLPGVTLPSSIKATTDIKEAATAKEYIILSSPSLFVLNTVKEIITVPNIMEGESKIAMIAKGFLEGPSGPQLLLKPWKTTCRDFIKGMLSIFPDLPMRKKLPAVRLPD